MEKILIEKVVFGKLPFKASKGSFSAMKEKYRSLEFVLIFLYNYSDK